MKADTDPRIILSTVEAARLSSARRSPVVVRDEVLSAWGRVGFGVALVGAGVALHVAAWRGPTLPLDFLYFGTVRGQVLVGAGSALLLFFNLAVAARKRAWVRQGGYAEWVRLHLVSTLVGLTLLSAHVSGQGMSTVTRVAMYALSAALLSGVPGLFLWQRRARLGVQGFLQRHWLKVHVLLLGPLLAAIAVHVMQVLYY
jgi:hypothetical protein